MNWIVAFVRCGFGRYSAITPGVAALSRRERRQLYRLDRSTRVAFTGGEARVRDRCDATPAERIAWAAFVHHWSCGTDPAANHRSGVDS